MGPEALAVVSVEEFWRLAHRLPRAELVGGQVVEMAPPGFRHGAVTAALLRTLHEFVTTQDLGVTVAETGFVLSSDPPTVRAPDVAVVLRSRLPSPPPAGFFFGTPDLAVEVLSPDDRPAEVAAEVTDYLRAGAAAVWVVDPESRTVTVHTRSGATRYAAQEAVDGAPVLPGFHLPVGPLLAG